MLFLNFEILIVDRRQAPLHGKVFTGTSRDGSFHVSQFSSPDGSININNVNAGDMGGGFSITNNNVNGASQTIFSNGNGGTVITNTNNLGPNGFNSNNVNILNNGK